jgi:ABC-type molybdate transport system permease subunit
MSAMRPKHLCIAVSLWALLAYLSTILAMIAPPIVTGFLLVTCVGGLGVCIGTIRGIDLLLRGFRFKC